MKNKTKTYFSFYSYTKFLMLGTKLKESVFFIEKCQYSHNVLLSLYYKQSQKNWAYSLDQKFPIYGQKQWKVMFCLLFYWPVAYNFLTLTPKVWYWNQEIGANLTDLITLLKIKKRRKDRKGQCKILWRTSNTEWYHIWGLVLRTAQDLLENLLS